MVQTAADHFSHRGSRIRNSRQNQYSRVSTAGEVPGKVQMGLEDESKTHLAHNNSLAIQIMGNEDPVSSVASPKNMDDVGGPGKAILPALNGVAYPVPPDQPMLTDSRCSSYRTRP